MVPYQQAVDMQHWKRHVYNDIDLRRTNFNSPSMCSASPDWCLCTKILIYSSRWSFIRLVIMEFNVDLSQWLLECHYVRDDKNNMIIHLAVVRWHKVNCGGAVMTYWNELYRPLVLSRAPSTQYFDFPMCMWTWTWNFEDNLTGRVNERLEEKYNENNY